MNIYNKKMVNKEQIRPVKLERPNKVIANALF